jgi:bifunctional DNA-binding transcriptional regulator/antitoxin component of YhaV-PrlF toxin-antitoxin module
MIVTTMSGKNQTTIGKELVDYFGLKAGAKLRQFRDEHRIIIEPVGDIMSAFGALKTDVPMASIQQETEAAERAMADDAMKSMRDE